MVGGGLYDNVSFDAPIIHAVAAIPTVHQVNKYEKPARVIEKSEEDVVKKYLDKRKKKKQEMDSWV